jgi:glycerol dehydrogenase
LSNRATTSLTSLAVAPARILRGCGILPEAAAAIAHLGKRLLIVSGDCSSAIAQSQLQPALEKQGLDAHHASYLPDCSEASLASLRQAASDNRADCIIGVGGGKALDVAKLLAHQCQLPAVTLPTSPATCAAWTALSNIYSDAGAFQYDVPLNRAPDLLVLDYTLLQNAPRRLLVAGIGDALAKWYEASASSSTATATLTIAAVQQARVLRDILLQKSVSALQSPGGEDWREVVDATVLLAGVIGGLGGADCRTVAAHAVHNGLTHLPAAHETLHGEKVAYGILVQLRLEEMHQGSQLAAAARQQLLEFYNEVGLTKSLEDLGLQGITLAQLRHCAEVATLPNSDIHRLPFPVLPDLLVAAMVSTTESESLKISGKYSISYK